MPTSYIRRGSALRPGQAGKADASPIYVNSSTSTVKVVPGSTGTTETELCDLSTAQTLTNKTLTSPTISNPTLAGKTPVSVTGAAVTLGPTHVGRTVVLNRAAGIAVTLPAATGSGDEYTLVVGTTFTAAATVAVVDGTDFMIGVAQMGIDGGSAVPHQYPTANSGVLATESDTISLFGTANSQGGFKGAQVYLTDIALDTWNVLYISDAAGTEATPFSAAV